MGKLLSIAAILAVLAYASQASSAAEPEPEPEDPEAEARACTSAVADRPEIEGGIPRGDRPLDAWLAWVAFFRAYGRPPRFGDDDRLDALLACVRARLEAKGDEPPDIADVPTPGRWYRIRYGDTLFGLSKVAYPGGVALDGKPAANFLAARLINEASENRRFWRPVPSEAALFPKGRITFLPIFGTFEEQRADEARGGEVGAGGGYAVIWVPPRPA